MNYLRTAILLAGLTAYPAYYSLSPRTDTRKLHAAFTVLLLLVASYTAWRALPALT